MKYSVVRSVELGDSEKQSFGDDHILANRSSNAAFHDDDTDESVTLLHSADASTDIEIGVATQEAKRVVTLSVPSFVPAWEGLRGVAVCMTCLSHVVDGFAHEVAGRGGVAIFFVLSGFLITGVLEKQQSSRQHPGERFHYRHLMRFYTDRNVRLYPAVVALILVTGALEVYLNNGVMRYGLVYEAMRSLTYTSNLAIGPGYGSIWANTWSLAVEEQFYIVWSLLLPLLLVLRPGARRGIILALALSSFAVHFLGKTGALTSNHLGNYSPFANFWKMYVGALLRLSPGVPRWLLHRATGWCGLLGVAMLCLWSALPSPPDLSTLGFRSTYLQGRLYDELLMTVFGACAVLGTMHEGNALLQTDALRFLGRISYAWYLYQFPMLLLGCFPNPNFSQLAWPHGYLGTSITGLSVIFATVSTLYIEEPLRTRYRKWRVAQGGAH